MNTTDTTPTTDLVIIDAELLEDDAESAENTVGKTIATTAATSAIVIGAVLAYKFFAPKVTALLVNRKKNETEAETVVVVTETTPETAEV